MVQKGEIAFRWPDVIGTAWEKFVHFFLLKNNSYAQRTTDLMDVFVIRWISQILLISLYKDLKRYIWVRSFKQGECRFRITQAVEVLEYRRAWEVSAGYRVRPTEFL